MKKLKESQKIWIRGIPGKKYKILSILKNLGGISYNWYEGEDKDFIFYITPNSVLDEGKQDITKENDAGIR